MLYAGIAFVVLASATAIYVMTRPDSSSSAFQPPSEAGTKPVVLPAVPHRPRPVALDPNQFKDPEVRAAYEAARNNPELLEQMPCYCGCYGNSGHTNNLDCFTDRHGET